MTPFELGMSGKAVCVAVMTPDSSKGVFQSDGV